MRKGSAVLAIIMMAIVLLVATLWFYGYETDSTNALKNIEKIKRVQKEGIVNVAKRYPHFVKACKEVPNRQACIKSKMQEDLLHILNNNLKRGKI